MNYFFKRPIGRMKEAKRIFLQDLAPGMALRNSMMYWSRLQNTELTCNIYNLHPKERHFLKTCYPSIAQVEFNPRDVNEFTAQVERADGYSVIVARLVVNFNERLLKALSSSSLQQPLHLLGQAGSSVSHIDLETATERNIAVTYAPGSNASAVAEFVIAQALALTRSSHIYNAETHKHAWSKYQIPPAEGLEGKTLGLIGFGHIGQQVALKAQALGLSVMAYTRTPEKIKQVSGVVVASSLQDLLNKSDIISMHASAPRDVGYLIGETEIKLMQDAYFINTARGYLVDEKAVAAELRKKDSKLLGVAFDVFEKEGTEFDSPLVGLPNALLTPHIAATTNQALTNAAVTLVKNIDAILAKSAKVSVANPEVLKKDE